MSVSSDAVRTLPLFADLNPEQAGHLAAHCHMHVTRRGEYLFLHGDPIKNFKVVCRGTVQLFRSTPDGHEVTSDILISGDCVNAEEIILNFSDNCRDGSTC